MENTTLMIDPATHDLVLDSDGNFVLIGAAETVAQCIRLTLEAFKGEWFLDVGHGTDYMQLLGEGGGDPETVLRTAVFQETAVRFIDRLDIGRSERGMNISFSGRLQDETPISLEVQHG